MVDMKELQKYLDENFNLGQERKVQMHTGRQGAIDYQIRWNKSMGIQSSRKDLLKQFKRNGVYSITDFGVEYIGLFNPDVPDGVHVVKSEEYYWVEWWEDGACVKYAEITEQEFHKLKDSQNHEART